MMAWNRWNWFLRLVKSKTSRMIIMLILTFAIAVAEIVYGIRTRSQLLIADGLFSFAECIALVGSLFALRYAKAQQLHSKNTFGWARLELLAGLLQEVLLLSLSLSIIVDAINKLINPNHIEDPTVMIYLGSGGFFVGLLGLFLFRGYHHDHNIRHEIFEQKKHDFVQNVCNTLKNLDLSHLNNEQTRDQQEASTALTNMNEQKRKRYELILPSLNDTYANAFLVADRVEQVYLDTTEEEKSEQSTSNEMIHSLNTNLNGNHPSSLDDHYQESRVYATLHALCLHSLAVLLESSIVLITGLLNRFVPKTDPLTGDLINAWLKYIDPSLTLLMVIIISVKAIPVIWSLGHILVEAVPSGINTRHLIQTILKTIPQIRAVHSVHVWRATARDVFATLHVVCNEDLPLSTCTNRFGQQFERIFETYCIRHFTIQYEYIPSNENIHRCSYGTRRRQRGHQSSSEDTENIIQTRITVHADTLQINANVNHV